MGKSTIRHSSPFSCDDFMKVIMVSPLAYPYVGGVESHVLEVSKRLMERNIEVEIYSTDPSGRFEEVTDLDGLIIRRFRSFAPNGIYHFSKELYSSLKDARADIVHSHDFKSFPMLAAALAKTQNGIPLVVTLHYGFTKVGKSIHTFYDSVFGRLILQRADAVILVSPVEMNLISELRKVEEKIKFLPNGIPVKEISTYLSSKEFKNNGQPPLKILFVGRLEKKKGPHLLIEAFQRLTQLTSEDVELLIVGEGPFKQELESLVERRRLQDNVHMLGRVGANRLYELYAQSHIFVLPSEFEAHSIAITEAIAFGLVPVVTNVGGNRLLVTNGSNGFLIRHPVEVDELSSVLFQLVENHDLRHAMSMKALEKAKSFDIDRTVKSLETLYRSL